MTTYTHEHLEKAYELGRIHERHKMADLASITGAQIIATAPAEFAAGNKRKVLQVNLHGPVGQTVRKVSALTKAARGIRKDTGSPRAKGVKEAVMNMIASSTIGMTTAEIIAQRPDLKATSINATLMGLQRANLVSKDGKHWFSAAPAGTSGNGDAETPAYV